MSELLDTVDAEAPAAALASRSAVPPIRPTDAERLMRFWRRHDQAALEELIERHAAMVWGVCSQVLRRREDVEDAFQATFLILARKAHSIRAADSIAGWLYRVAFRTALLAHNRRNRRAETLLAFEPATDDDQLETIARNEQCRVLLEELHALPLQYREPLVLCYLEGRSRNEAADELGVTPQSVKGRLARGTRMLRSRMVSRGAALSTTMAMVAASMSSAQAAAPPALVSTTAALGASFATKLTGAGAKATAAKTAATVLAEKGILSMTLIAAVKPAVAVLAVCLAAGMFAVATADGPAEGGVGGGSSPLVLLADSDEGDDVLEASGDDIELTIDEVLDEPRIDEAPVAPAAPSEPKPKPQPAAAAAPVALAAPAAAPAVPSAPAPVAAVAAMPAESAWTLIGGGGNDEGPGPIIQALPQRAAAAAGSFNFRMPSPADPFAVSFPRIGASGGSSEQSLKLEREYWDIKANALKKKAEALMSKAEALDESGSGSRTEVLEARADAELTLAEVKLCEVNALKVKEQLDALTAGKLKRGSKGVQVRMLQQQLNTQLKPSPQLDVDGDFGSLTEEAVKLFQKANDLPQTGVIDEKTAMVLGLAIHPGADVLFRRADVLKEAPIQIQKRIEARAPLNEPRPARIVVGEGMMRADGAGQFKKIEPPKVRVQIEKAATAAKEAAAKQAAAAERAAQTAAKHAETDALRAELDAMRAALKELQEQLKAAEAQADESR